MHLCFTATNMEITLLKTVIVITVIELCQHTMASTDQPNSVDVNDAGTVRRNATLIALSTKDMSAIFQSIFSDYDLNVLPSKDGGPLNIKCGIYINDMVPVEPINMVSFFIV